MLLPAAHRAEEKGCIPTDERLSAEKQVTQPHFGGIFRVLLCEKRRSRQNYGFGHGGSTPVGSAAVGRKTSLTL
jgi:hypothetical protein